MSSQDLLFVRDVIVQSLKANPAFDSVKAALELLKAVGYQGDSYPEPQIDPQETKPYDPPQEDLRKAEYAVRESIPIVAPYPSSALGGDFYNALTVTDVLPEFDQLPFEFNDKFSVIRSGEQTVVMNAAHYVDLLQLREIAKAAVNNERVMQDVALAAAHDQQMLFEIIANRPIHCEMGQEGIEVSFTENGRIEIIKPYQSCRVFIRELHKRLFPDATPVEEPINATTDDKVTE